MSNVTDMFTPLPRELIKGQPKYQCILKDQECSFWYSPDAKDKFALLLHDEHGNPWDCGKYKKFGMYTNKLHELLTPDLSLDKQEILDVLRELEPAAVEQYEKYKGWHSGRPAKRTRNVSKKPEIQKVADLNNRWENRKQINCEKQEELKEQIKDLTGETPEGAIKHYCPNKAAAETLSEYVEAQRVSKQLLLTQEKEKGPQR